MKLRFLEGRSSLGNGSVTDPFPMRSSPYKHRRRFLLEYLPMKIQQILPWILGFCLTGIIIQCIYTLNLQSARSDLLSNCPEQVSSKPHTTPQLTAFSKHHRTPQLKDSDILRDDKDKERIHRSMKLYEQKMKFLKDRKMIRTMRKRPVCSEKTKPMAWCYDSECKAKLPPVGSLETFQSLTKPLRRLQNGVLSRIPEIFGNDVIEKRKYVFLLAISANHFMEAQQTLRSLHTKVFPLLTNYSFYCYDMGLTQEQSNMIRKYGKAIVRRYPFHLLPPRVHNLKSFTWKAVMIQAHIDMAEFLVYADASVFFVANPVPMFQLANITGFLMCPGHNNLAKHTSTSMFSYFGDEACSYSSYTEYEGGFLVFHNEPFSRTLILEPWLACTLDPNCIEGTKPTKGGQKAGKYGVTHRTDQSAMSVILVKLFRDDMSTFASPRGRFHGIKQGRLNIPFYLKELQDRDLEK